MLIPNILKVSEHSEMTLDNHPSFTLLEPYFHKTLFVGFSISYPTNLNFEINTGSIILLISSPENHLVFLILQC